MKPITKYLIPFFLVCLFSLATTMPASAIPPLPSSFYGTVKVNGQNVPDGTVVRALMNGQEFSSGFTRMYENDSVFALDVPGDDASTDQVEGGVANAVISFQVGGVQTTQTGVWKSGTNIRLDLTVTSTTPIAGPVNTPTPHATQTAIKRPTTRPTATKESEPADTRVPNQPAAPAASSAAAAVNNPAATGTPVVSQVEQATKPPSATKPAVPGLAQQATQPASGSAEQPASSPAAPASDLSTAQPPVPTTAGSSSVFIPGAIVLALAAFGGLAWTLVRKNRSTH